MGKKHASQYVNFGWLLLFCLQSLFLLKVREDVAKAQVTYFTLYLK